MNKVLKAWKVYLDTAHTYDWAPPEAYQDGDIAHLKSIGACKELIEAAEYHFGLTEVGIVLAPNEDFRNWSSEFMFKYSLPIQSMDGDYVLMMDCRDPNSIILSWEHDYPRFTVIADNLVDLLEGLTHGYQTPNFKEMEENAWANYYDEVFPDPSPFIGDDCGLIITEKDGQRVADFTNATLGAETPPDFFSNGKYFDPIDGVSAGILTLEKLSSQDIKTIKRKNIFGWLFVIGTYALVTGYLYVTCDPTCPKCNLDCTKCESIFGFAWRGFFITLAIFFFGTQIIMSILDSKYLRKRLSKSEVHIGRIG